ncbi:thioesterase family protein [Marivita sp. XM-24bin2]|jgi:acyl-CoA thioesterase FadM|uniref:thioesterase family protein n=1 Tax=unclassified Marivita TaxID=2632480 RepID=UPI000D79CFCD|nr:thioesterase family protein [Marivita sp. XM-24bin2]MCR9109193.1 thioesterase family protein [Paracoccaceae bacterium]PWL34757.1 MAG: thioeseterase [Marivita sp. XM-24bin2]
MYPFIRMAFGLWKTRNTPKLGPFATYVSHHRCWPWDIDMWMELNNGRTLTLYDLGRIPLAQVTGLMDMIRNESWGLTMAGVVVRYRRRIRTFERFETRSRLLCWDARFLYIEQSMWKQNGECANHAVYRSAVTDRNGIVPTSRVIAAMGLEEAQSPGMPIWVKKWLEAEDARPWPPMQNKA